MKRIVCLLLVLVFCMYLPCAAYAAVPSPGESAPTVPSGPSETRDASHVTMWTVIMIVSLLAIAVLVFAFRKFIK